jgi:hypothetical protein
VIDSIKEQTDSSNSFSHSPAATHALPGSSTERGTPMDSNGSLRGIPVSFGTPALTLKRHRFHGRSAETSFSKSRERLQRTMPEQSRSVGVSGDPRANQSLISGDLQPSEEDKSVPMNGTESMTLQFSRIEVHPRMWWVIRNAV